MGGDVGTFIQGVSETISQVCVIVCHGVSWCVIVCHGVSECVMVCHSVSWTRDSRLIMVYCTAE